MSGNSHRKGISSADVSRNFKKRHSSYEMNKPLILGGVLVLLLALGCLVYWIASNNLGASAVPELTDTTVASTPTYKGKGGGANNVGKDATPKFQYNSFNGVRNPSTGNRYSIFSIEYKPELANRIALFSSKGQNIGSFLRLMKRQPVSDSMLFTSDEDFFAITGAMYDTDNLPIGLTVTGGVQLKDLNTMSGKGNFFEPSPNGVFYIDDDEAGIVATSDYSNSNPDFALQSGPVLVINGNINPGITDMNVSKYNRCAVGIKKTGKSRRTLVFVCSIDKISMSELAKYMKSGLGCSEALHLESINAYIHFPGLNFPIQKQSIKNFIVIK
jgi:uncharacterized protein YigE (DUF2233 family)